MPSIWKPFTYVFKSGSFAFRQDTLQCVRVWLGDMRARHTWCSEFLVVCADAFILFRCRHRLKQYSQNKSIALNIYIGRSIKCNLITLHNWSFTMAIYSSHSFYFLCFAVTPSHSLCLYWVNLSALIYFFFLLNHDLANAQNHLPANKLFSL